jgi:hypothetical protein
MRTLPRHLYAPNGSNGVFGDRDDYTVMAPAHPFIDRPVYAFGKNANDGEPVRDIADLDAENQRRLARLSDLWQDEPKQPKPEPPPRPEPTPYRKWINVRFPDGHIGRYLGLRPVSQVCGLTVATVEVAMRRGSTAGDGFRFWHDGRQEPEARQGIGKVAVIVNGERTVYSSLHAAAKAMKLGWRTAINALTTGKPTAQGYRLEQVQKHETRAA